MILREFTGKSAVTILYNHKVLEGSYNGSIGSSIWASPSWFGVFGSTGLGSSDNSLWFV